MLTAGMIGARHGRGIASSQRRFYHSPPVPPTTSIMQRAKLVALCTLISRFTGLARDVLLAHAFGASWVQDAFAYAFQFPNLFRRLFGEGGLTPVFVPKFTRTLELEGRPAAWRLLSSIFALMTITLTALMVIVQLILLVIWLFSGDADPQQAQARALLLSLTAIMLPFMVSICLLALLSSILNCIGSFVPAASAPILLNLCMIAGLLWLGPLIGGGDPARQVYGVAISVLIAGFLQIAYVWPALRANGVALRWHVDRRDAGVREILRMLPPVALGQGVLAFGVFLDAQVCTMLSRLNNGPPQANWFGVVFDYPLREGALSAITYAARLYQFPLGVLVISIGTAALPAFSALAARRDWDGWISEVRSSLRLAIFEGLLAGVMMAALAEPIVRFLFEYRRFDADDTARTARVLTWYALGMWAFCAQHIVLRGFYSISDVRTPLRISCAILPLNVALNLILIWYEPIREAAFAISSSITASLAVIWGLAVLQRRTHTKVIDGDVARGLLRMLTAAGASFLAVTLLVRPIHEFSSQLPGRVLQRGTETLGLLAIGGGIYLLAAMILRLPEAEFVLGRLARRWPFHRQSRPCC